MRISIVTEFGTDNYFQWRNEFNIDRQTKLGVVVDSVCINPQVLSKYDDNNNYFSLLRKADLVFCYSSRTHEPNYPYNRNGIEYHWNWWELPKIAKKYMHPEAKMIAQNDDDWIWLKHPEWTWWSDKPDTHGGPTQFFRDTGILEVADMWFTVLESPYWMKHTFKPVKYMPLPHLWRYTPDINKANELYNKKGVPFMHNNSVALMKHTSNAASIDGTVHNVIEKLGLPITYFATEWGNVTSKSYKVPISIHKYLTRDRYMGLLMNNCSIAIDDADKYTGWSRFVMECALTYIPCIGSNYATKLFFPDLYTKHNDYDKQTALALKLLNDKDYYKKVVDEAHIKVSEHLNPDRLCNELIRLANEELYVKSLPMDIELELLKNILRKTLPFAIVPQRPSENQSIYDDFHHRQCDMAQWDIWYGKYKRFISNESVYNSIIREVLDEK